MNDLDYQRGVAEAEADIAAGACRLFIQTRGSWGELFTKLMRDRFEVQVVHVSDIAWESKLSHEHGYNCTVIAHLNATFGDGEYDRTWNESQEYRLECYRRSLGSQQND